MARSDDTFFLEIFAKSYVRNGLNLSKAYNIAMEGIGKEPLSSKSASQLGGQLVNKPKAKEMIEEQKIIVKAELEKNFIDDRQKIIDSMWKTYDKAMEEQQSFDRNGKPIAKYDVNSISGANKSLELLAKTTGLLIDKVETKNENNHVIDGVIEVELV